MADKKIIGKANNRKGQIALWVILSLVLAAAIALFFFVQKRPAIGMKAEFNPEQYIKKCASENVEEAVDKMLPQGGFLEPSHYKIYNDTKIEYLCKQDGYYNPCINMHPTLLSEITSQIESYIEPNIESCFQSVKTESEKKSIGIELGDMEINVSLAPGRVFVNIARKITITEGQSRREIEGVEAEIINPIYDIASVAIDIANNQAKYCYFESTGYMIMYERWNIRNFPMSDSTKIYTIRDNYSGKIMNFAIRSCPQPPGWGGL